MTLGPGKYDEQCTAARRDTDALGVLLIVFNGRYGHGFSAQLPAEILPTVPEILRQVAREIEASIPRA
jgi:hypothetical protein